MANDNQKSCQQIENSFYDLKEKFFRQEMPLGEFSRQCNLLWLALAEIKSSQQKELDDILAIAMDLDYYFHHNKEIYQDWLQDIKNYPC